jgi:hypothetical protein
MRPWVLPRTTSSDTYPRAPNVLRRFSPLGPVPHISEAGCVTSSPGRLTTADRPSTSCLHTRWTTTRAVGCPVVRCHRLQTPGLPDRWCRSADTPGWHMGKPHAIVPAQAPSAATGSRRQHARRGRGTDWGVLRQSGVSYFIQVVRYPSEPRRHAQCLGRAHRRPPIQSCERLGRKRAGALTRASDTGVGGDVSDLQVY